MEGIATPPAPDGYATSPGTLTKPFVVAEWDLCGAVAASLPSPAKTDRGPDLHAKVDDHCSKGPTMALFRCKVANGDGTGSASLGTSISRTDPRHQASLKP